MSDQTYQVTIDGTISWDLIFDLDNTTNSGTIQDKITITTTESLEYTSFEQSFNETVRKELEKNHVGSEAGASYEGITAKVDASIDVSTEITDTLQETTSTTFKSNYSKTTTYERNSMYPSQNHSMNFILTMSLVVVGPNSKLSLYQQRFSAPGMSVLGSAVSTNPPPSETITIQYLVRPIRFISDIQVHLLSLCKTFRERLLNVEYLSQVHYGDHPSDAPANRVLEYTGQNDDINANYGGK